MVCAGELAEAAEAEDVEGRWKLGEGAGEGPLEELRLVEMLEGANFEFRACWPKEETGW